MTETAHSYLERAEGREVVVRLKDRSLKGILRGFDDFLNLHLEKVEETLDGRTRTFEQLVIRGSQVLSVQASVLGPQVAASQGTRLWSGSRSDRSASFRPRGSDAPFGHSRR